LNTTKLALSRSDSVFRKNGKSLSSDFFHHEKFFWLTLSFEFWFSDLHNQACSFKLEIYYTVSTEMLVSVTSEYWQEFLLPYKERVKMCQERHQIILEEEMDRKERLEWKYHRREM
jgi:hypothetical protein